MDTQKLGVMTCLDNGEVEYSDEDVMACLDKNNKDGFDEDFLLPHPPEYLFEETLGGNFIVHHGYMNIFFFSWDCVLIVIDRNSYFYFPKIGQKLPLKYVTHQLH